MTGSAEKRETVWGKRALKLVIVAFLFPVLVLLFDLAFAVPTALVGLLLVPSAGHLEFWAITLSFAALIPACCGAGCLCKWIWAAPR